MAASPSYQMSPIARLFRAYAGLQIALALASLVRTKVTAVNLGPTHYGEFAQLVSVSGLFVAVASLGLGVALGRGLAVSNDGAQRQRMLSTSISLTVALSTALCGVALLLIWSGDFLRMVAVPTSTSTAVAAAVSVVAVPAICIQGLYIAALQGLMDAGGTARARGIAVGLATLAGIPLIVMWGIVGASLAALLVATFTGIALGLRLRKLGFHATQIAWSRDAATALLPLGLASVASSVAHSGAEVVTRGLAISQLGPNANGLIQAPLSVTGLAQGILLGSIGAFSVAVIARASNPFQVRIELTRMIDFVVPIAALGFAVLGALAPLVLRLLFTTEFAEAEPLFLPIVLFQFTVVLYWIVGSPLLAAGRAWLWLALDLIGAVAKIMLTWQLMPRLGISGLPIALLLFALLHLILSLAALRFALGVVMPWSRYLTCTLGAGAVALCTWLPGVGVAGIGASALLVVALSVWSLATLRSQWAKESEGAS